MTPCLKREIPDVVILATGAKPSYPPIPGIDLPNVVQAWDVLLDKVTTGKQVVIIGGGAVGVETALFLAQKGTLSGDALKFLLVNQAGEPEVLLELATKGTKDVVIIEMTSDLGRDIGSTTRWTMMQDINRMDVSVQKGLKAVAFTSKGVRVEQEGHETELVCDTIVLASGAKPCNPLQKILEQKGVPFRVVGDANKIGLAMDAVHQGFTAGKSV